MVVWLYAGIILPGGSLPAALGVTTAPVAAAHGTGLVQATPARPVQHQFLWGQDAHDQPVDQSTDLGNGERNQAVAGGQLRHQRPPLSPLPGRWERTTAR